MKKIRAKRIKQLTLLALAILAVIVGADFWHQRVTYSQLQVELATELNASDWSYAKFPLRPDDFIRYTSPYGERWGRLHAGVDIAVEENRDVIAWWDGVVEDAITTDRGGCGKEVFIVSGNWDYRYCHLNSVTVQKGDKVKAGQVVAKSGNTGSSQGPHLHWEVRFRQNLVDPARVIRKMQEADKEVQPSSFPINNSLHKRDQRLPLVY